MRGITGSLFDDLLWREDCKEYFGELSTIFFVWWWVNRVIDFWHEILKNLKILCLKLTNIYRYQKQDFIVFKNLI